MKKTFLATRNTFLSSSNISWGTFTFAIALFVLALRLLMPNTFWYVFAPLFRAADTLAAKNHVLLNSIGQRAELAAHYERMVDENTALIAENQVLLKKEAALVALLGSPVPEGPRGILAGVVARPPESPYDTFVLAAGSLDGVILGQEAFGAGGVPLGVVSSVLAHFSRVTLFSAPGVVTHGWVGSASTALVITGAGAGAMNANISRSAGVLEGDTVFVPGPGMLPVGTVVRIDHDPASPSVTLRIQPAVNLFSVSWVTLRDTGATLAGSSLFTTPTRP